LRLFKAIKQSNISIKRAFQIIDNDKSGEITKAEMQRAFSQIGITTTVETVNYLFKLCDYNNDGNITEP
jgi:Ca2+-binding EF-hand superfamily protein